MIRMKRRFIAAICVLLACGLSFSALTAVPSFLPTQGIIRDNTGTPVFEGTFSVLFSLYDSVDGTEPLWTEAWPPADTDCDSDPTMCIQVSEGLFHVQLGSISPLNPTVFSGSSIWLGISVEGEPELPRTRLGTAAYAFVAASAEYAVDAGTLWGQSPSDFEPAGAADAAVTAHEASAPHLTAPQHQALTGGPTSIADEHHSHAHEGNIPHLTAPQHQALTGGPTSIADEHHSHAHEGDVPHLTAPQHQALTGGPSSVADEHHSHTETQPPLPPGMIAFFASTECPPGWTEYGPLRGRLVVGVSSQDTVGAEVGTALGDQGTRSITAVPAHAHQVDPPQATSASGGGSHTHSMSHTHSINPPNTGTSGGGAHTHNLQDGIGIGDGLVGVNVGGGGHPGAPNQSGNGPALNTTSNGNHSHSVDIGSFGSGGSSAGQTGGGDSAHSHAVDIPSFASASSGDAAVDVTMPYLQLLACQFQ